MKIGVAGLGALGKPLAEKLAEKQGSVMVYNRSSEKSQGMEKQGILVAENFSQLCTYSEVIIFMVKDSLAINQLIDTLDGFDGMGKTIIQMGTIEPDQSVELKEKVEKLGFEYMEAPVLGSIPDIRSEKLITLVGSTKEQFEKWRPLFINFGQEIHYIGIVGKASSIKLALNHLIAALTASFSLSLNLIRKSGVDVEQFMEILRKSALYAPTFDKKLNRMLEGNYDSPNFSALNMLKDVNLIKSLMGKYNLETSTLTGLEKILENTINKGFSDKDYSSLYEGTKL